MIGLVERLAPVAIAATLLVGVAILTLSLRGSAPPLLSLPNDTEILSSGRLNADVALVPLTGGLVNVGFFTVLIAQLWTIARVSRRVSPDFDDRSGADDRPDFEDQFIVRDHAARPRAALATFVTAIGRLGWLALVWAIAPDIVADGIRIGLRVANVTDKLSIAIAPNLPLVAVGLALWITAGVVRRLVVDVDDARHTV